MKDPIWEGVYADFDAAPGSTSVFAEELWVERSRAKARDMIAAIRPRGAAPAAVAAQGYALPLVASLVQAGQGGVRVLDFGGSVGFAFPLLVGALGDPDRFHVAVVDNPRICAAGREVFAGEPRITFSEDLPSGGTFDIVHCGSSLQYVRDTEALLARLAAVTPRYLVLDDLPAGNVQTFVSTQNYYGKKIPHWFFSLPELVARVSRATGFRLIHQERYVGTYLGVSGPMPLGNLPADRRIEHALNLVFERPHGSA